jgi:hypothetical protein
MYFSHLSELHDHPFQYPIHEVQLLERALGYSLHYKLKQWTEHSALEAEAASTFSNLNGQEGLWFTVARSIKLLINRNIQNAQRTKHEYNLINKIKVKVNENTLVITKVDKGKTLVILEKEYCHNKVHTFLQDNECTKLNCSPINAHQKGLTTTMKLHNYYST